MLAYIFWHFPEAGVDVRDYEKSLRDFHASLGESGAEGFVRSTSFRVRDAPWINAGAPAYADWYLVEGSFALDTLNEVAVSGARQERHDRAAGWAAAGAGGLYRLRDGQAGLDAPRIEAWLTKPRSISYRDFYAAIGSAATGPGVELWRRQMVLGPAPEFCLLAPAAPRLPAAVRLLEVRREPLAA